MLGGHELRTAIAVGLVTAFSGGRNAPPANSHGNGVARAHTAAETRAQWKVSCGTGTSIASPLATAASIWASVRRCSLAAALLGQSTRIGPPTQSETAPPRE